MRTPIGRKKIKKSKKNKKLFDKNHKIEYIENGWR